MKKESIITASYLLVSVGLFTLAINLWICGGESFCRNSGNFVSYIAEAASDASVQIVTQPNGWSGSANPDFTINFAGATASQVFYSPGDGH